MQRLKRFLSDTLAVRAIHWKLTAVLLAGSFVAYGILIVTQYRDQYDKIVGFAETSHGLLTEVMVRRIDDAVSSGKIADIDRALVDTARITERLPTSVDGSGSHSGLTILGVLAYDRQGELLRAYRAPLRVELPRDRIGAFAETVARTRRPVDTMMGQTHLIVVPIAQREGAKKPISVVAVAWDMSPHLEAAWQAITRNAINGALATLALILVLLLVVHRLVTRPMSALTKQFAELGLSGEPGFIDDKLVQRHDEIGVLAGEFNRMVEALADSRQKLQNQSYVHGMAEMASGVLHNIRNALNPISVGIWRLEEMARAASLGRVDKALNELADPAVPDDRKRKLVSYVRGAAEKLVVQQHRLADEIKELGEHSQHIEQILQDVDLTGRRRRQAEAIALDKLAEDCARMIPSKEGAPVTVEIDTALARLPDILGNRITLTQVLGNLMVNAAESIRAAGVTDGRIEVTGGTETIDGRQMVHLELRDNGEGIAPEAMGSLFQRGFSTKKEKKGGIGLHWCANSIIAMGGKIHASSEGLGHGAAFHLLLPVSPLRGTEQRIEAA